MNTPPYEGGVAAVQAEAGLTSGGAPALHSDGAVEAAENGNGPSVRRASAQVAASLMRLSAGPQAGTPSSRRVIFEQVQF